MGDMHGGSIHERQGSVIGSPSSCCAALERCNLSTMRICARSKEGRLCTIPCNMDLATGLSVLPQSK